MILSTQNFNDFLELVSDKKLVFYEDYCGQLVMSQFTNMLCEITSEKRKDQKTRKLSSREFRVST